MQVTRDIVIDLLPLYQSNEASQDSRAAIEEFLRKDPSLAQMASQDATVVPTNAASELERQTIMRTRAAIRRRSWILAAAIWFTLLPFSFVFRGGQITFFMLRDQPASSALFLVVGAVMWVLYARMTHSLRAAGL